MGKRIQKARRVARQTTEDVARAAGIPVDTLRRIEQGRVFNPGLFTVAAVASAIGLRLEDLVRPTESE